MLNYLLEATSGATENAGSQWWVYLILLGLVIVMLIVPSISNKKRAKEYNEMVNAIGVGDTVRTVGGIIGRVTKINDKDGYKTFILETGAKNTKSTMEFDIASIYTVINSKNKPAVAPEQDSKEKPAETESAKEVKDAVEEAKPEDVESVKVEKATASKKNSKKVK